jgi:fumarylacetoacetase
MSLGRPAWRETRAALQRLLSADEGALRDNPDLRSTALIPQADATMHLPASIGDYTDFFCSKEHAVNCGVMFRGPDNPLNPNWLHLPVAYHGRASSIVVSGTEVRRPWGQTAPTAPDAPPTFQPSSVLDFELEMGAFIGPGNDLGAPISINSAADHIFGMVLVNDWSARDVQRWEYVPLGPFAAKNWATSISPWIVTLDALEPFAVASPPQDPPPLPYLAAPSDDKSTASVSCNYDVRLEASIRPEDSTESYIITRSNMKTLYWTVQQMVAHHTAGGCNLRSGDLVATGTLSTEGEGGQGCLLELSWSGSRTVALGDSGGERRFLADGDEVTLSGYCQGEGFRVGFGECRGRVLPALQRS